MAMMLLFAPRMGGDAEDPFLPQGTSQPQRKMENDLAPHFVF
jgi:hypothetical protein